MVVSASISRVNNFGWADLYFDGNKIDQIQVDGRSISRLLISKSKPSQLVIKYLLRHSRLASETNCSPQ